MKSMWQKLEDLLAAEMGKAKTFEQFYFGKIAQLLLDMFVWILNHTGLVFMGVLRLLLKVYCLAEDTKRQTQLMWC